MLDGLKLVARQSAKRLAIAGGLAASSVARNLHFGQSLAGRGVIFTLHHVRPQGSRGFRPNAHLEVTPEFLDRALAAVIEAGYEPVALAELPSRLAHGDPSRKLAAFTLDDGYRDNAEFAAPVFTRHGVPFTIFVTRGFSERSHTIWWETLERLVSEVDEFEYDFGNGAERISARGLLNKTAAYERVGGHIIGPDEQVAVDRLNRAALACGVDPFAIAAELIMDKSELKALLDNPLAHYGAHTVSHRATAYLTRDAAAGEMMASAIFVSELTGRRTGIFAFPYGFASSVSARDTQLALECGFDLAVTTAPGTLTEAATARMGGLPRVSLNGLYQKTRHVTALASGIPFKLMR